MSIDDLAFKQRAEGVNLPINIIPSSDITVYVFTPFGKIRYALGVPFREMAEGYDYHSKKQEFNPNNRDNIVNIYYGQTRYRKKGERKK